MSFGFSAGDFIAAMRLAAEIYEKCFTKAQGAGKLEGALPHYWDGRRNCRSVRPRDDDAQAAFGLKEDVEVALKVASCYPIDCFEYFGV